MRDILSRLMVLVCLAACAFWMLGSFSNEALAESNLAHYRAEGIGPKVKATLYLD